MHKLNPVARATIVRAIGATLALAAPVAAFAQGDPFATALTDITAKVTTYGGGLIALAAVGVVFMVGVKYVKKLRGAA